MFAGSITLMLNSQTGPRCLPISITHKQVSNSRDLYCLRPRMVSFLRHIHIQKPNLPARNMTGATAPVRSSLPRRPSHFLSLPIQDVLSHERAQELANLLLKAVPRPDGVDESLVVKPKSLHLTLGIMALVVAQKDPIPVPVEQDNTVISKGKEKQVKSVSDAARLLRESQDGIQEIVLMRATSAHNPANRKIDIRLNRLESFQSDPKKCRVLYAEPEKDSESTILLHEIGGELNFWHFGKVCSLKSA